MAITTLPGEPEVELHPQVTVITGAGTDRGQWVERVRAAAERASAGKVVPYVVLAARDLPGARMVTQQAAPSQGSQRVDAARRALDAAKAAEGAARDELERVRNQQHAAATADDVAAAEGRLAAARAALDSAGEELAAAALEAEQETATARAAFEEQAADRRRRVEELEERRAGLVARRAELEPVLAEPDPPDTTGVEEALRAFDEHAASAAEPSPEGAALAGRWADAQRRLDEAPGADPPAWLLVPAEEALQRAREALRLAEEGAGKAALDPAASERVEEAHRRVLEAEQRLMDRPGMLSKRKVDGALEAEREALSAIGVKSYNEYLQIVASAGNDEAEQRVSAARAAVADAEAVWEELHRPLPTPERTAIEAELASLRNEAVSLLGREVDDDDIADTLRRASSGTDGSAAIGAVAEALQAVGVEPGEDPVGTARAFVREASASSRRRQDAQTGMSATAREAAWVEKTAGELAADLESEEPQPSAEVSARLAEARERSEVASDEVLAAERDLELVRERVALSASADDAVAAADARLSEATVTRERAEAELRRLEDEAAREVETPSGPVEVADLRNVVPLEAEIYVLARLAALRGGSAGEPAAVVVEDGFGGLPEDARRRLLDLLARASGVVQVVAVSDDHEMVAWAEGLGADSAAVATVS